MPERDETLRRSRSSRLLFRPGRGQVIAAVILFVVGLGLVMQLRISSAEDAYTNARREDLIQILDGLGAESRRLEAEITELEQTRTDLSSGADRQEVARVETERRLAQLAILAGTAPATGAGIRLTITDPQAKVSGEVLLDAIEEMRDAGAEVIEVNDSVRVVASSWFSSRDTASDRRQPNRQPADHAGGHRRPAQPRGGRVVPGWSGQRGHRTTDRRPGRDRTGVASGDRLLAHRGGESVRSASIASAHSPLIDKPRSRKCPTFPKI